MLNLDTHMLLLAVAGQLTRKEEALLGGDEWGISAIVLWEIAKLAERRRIELDFDTVDLKRVISQIQVWPITADVCRSMLALDFNGDPADELIAATSVVHSVPLVTRDRAILRSKVVPFAR